MGLLDDLLGGVLGGAAGQTGFGQRQSQASAGGGMGGVMMALLPVVLSMLASRGGGQSRGAMPQGGGGIGDILGQVLGGGQSGGGMGGLGGLIDQMQRTGYGDQARSWVGTGQNMPIQPDALDQIFGQGGMEEIARRAGVTPREATDGMSELLPEVVNHMTPQGELPDGDQLTQSVDDLRRRMGL